MKLEISELIHNVGRQNTVPIWADCPADEDLKCTEPIRGQLTLTNTGHHLLIRGDLATTVQVDCARCLQDALVPISTRIEEEFPLPKIDARGGAHWELEGEPVPSILQDYCLDVTELARQHLFLEVPITPVCDEACKGLCPGCGKNLNEGPCTCPPPEPDERLAGLQVFLDEAEGEDED